MPSSARIELASFRLVASKLVACSYLAHVDAAVLIQLATDKTSWKLTGH